VTSHLDRAEDDAGLLSKLAQQLRTVLQTDMRRRYCADIAFVGGYVADEKTDCWWTQCSAAGL